MSSAVDSLSNFNDFVFIIRPKLQNSMTKNYEEALLELSKLSTDLKLLSVEDRQQKSNLLE